MIMIKKITETTSTNDYLQEVIQQRLAEDDFSGKISSVIPEFFTVYALSQKNGKGQKGNSWYSEDGKNCLTSILIYPTVLPHEQFYLSKVVSLGIIDYLKTIIADHENISVKWPNDIYYKDKKLGGILIENTIIGDKILYSIIGIGLNLNQTYFPSTLPNPTSVSLITDIFFDMDEFTKNLINYVSNRYSIFVKKDIHIFDQDFLNNLYKYKTKHNFVVNQKAIEATIHGVSDHGKLQLLKDNCEIIECGFKEVSFQL